MPGRGGAVAMNRLAVVGTPVVSSEQPCAGNTSQEYATDLPSDRMKIKFGKEVLAMMTSRLIAGSFCAALLAVGLLGTGVASANPPPSPPGPGEPGYCGAHTSRSTAGPTPVRQHPARPRSSAEYAATTFLECLPTALGCSRSQEAHARCSSEGPPLSTSSKNWRRTSARVLGVLAAQRVG